MNTTIVNLHNTPVSGNAKQKSVQRQIESYEREEKYKQEHGMYHIYSQRACELEDKLTACQNEYIASGRPENSNKQSTKLQYKNIDRVLHTIETNTENKDVRHAIGAAVEFGRDHPNFWQKSRFLIIGFVAACIAIRSYQNREAIKNFMPNVLEIVTPAPKQPTQIQPNDGYTAEKQGIRSYVPR